MAQAVAMQDQGGISPSVWGILIGGVISLVTIVATWWTNRRKTDVDESALILGKWKDLVDTHEQRIKEITSEFTAYRTSTTQEMEGLRKRVQVLEDRDAKSQDRIRGLEEDLAKERVENAGLRRQIAQNSQSTAYQLKRMAGADDPIDEAVDTLHRLGDNLRGGE